MFAEQRILKNGQTAEASVRTKLWIVGLRPKPQDVLRVRYDPKTHKVFEQQKARVLG